MAKSPSPLLREVCEEKYFPQNLRIRTDQTRKHYRIMLSHFDRFLEHPATVADLTDENACGFANWLQNGRAIPTVNQRLNYLRSLWNWLAKKNIADQFPTFATIPNDSQIPRAWTIAQVKTLQQACRETRGDICCISASLWWEAFHSFIWDTGERTGATLALRWEWLDTETRIIVVPSQVRKTRHAMTYTLKLQTVELFQRIKEEQGLPLEGIVFRFQWSPETFYSHYGRLLKRAGLPSGRSNKPQKMRRTFASHLEKHGGNATEALGHSARKITEGSYLDPRIVERSPANAVLPSLAGKGGAV